MAILKTQVYGSYDDTMSWLKKLKFSHYMSHLEKCGQKGVDALRQATPKRTGFTSESWSYEIHTYPGKIEIVWKNSNIVNNVPIAVILQYGHGTRNGGYVQGIDYINPAMKPIFEEIENDIWKEIHDL